MILIKISKNFVLLWFISMQLRIRKIILLRYKYTILKMKNKLSEKEKRYINYYDRTLEWGEKIKDSWGFKKE